MDQTACLEDDSFCEALGEVKQGSFCVREVLVQEHPSVAGQKRGPTDICMAQTECFGEKAK